MLAGVRTALLVLCTVLVATMLTSGQAVADRQAQAPVAARSAAPPPAIASFRSPRTYDAIAAPIRLRIPAANVNSSLDRLRRNPDGSIATPTNPSVAGWYEEGPRPGQPGPAVMLGHFDSKTGPAVFFKLDTLRPGAEIYVDTADGHTVTFRVTGLERVPKDRFPTEQVYLPTLQRALRLVTCGGDFNRTAGHYVDNVIVYAVAV
jgi:Sortase domain